MKCLLTVLLFAITFTLSAQDCTCASNFDYMTKKVKANYIGYNDKINAQNLAHFSKFTDSLRNLSAKANASDCLALCKIWLGVFKDQHLNMVVEINDQSPDSIRSFFSDEERIGVSEKEFQSYLLEKKKIKDDVENIWVNAKGTYRVGVIRNRNKKNEFIGFILKADGAKWVEGQVKWRLLKAKNGYKILYYRAIDHSKSDCSFSKTADTLDFGVFGKWYKESSIKKEVPLAKNIDLAPRFEVLDSLTCLMAFPSFRSLAYIKVCDSLIKANRLVLDKSKHLIIDLRDNSGGSVSIVENLMPYIYTQPILTEGGIVLATEDNIRDRYAQEYPELSDSLQLMLKRNLEALKAHQGELYKLYPIDTIKFERVLKNPERVSFIVNKNTASASELFLLEARQSKKVKIYGENTAGAVDYVEVASPKMLCSFYSLWYPVVKSARLPAYPLDNIGIEPDIKIPSEVKDWIQFVKNNY